MIGNLLLRGCLVEFQSPDFDPAPRPLQIVATTLGL